MKAHWSTQERIRLLHALLGVGSALAYVTGELGIVHAWIGYGVSVVILIRLIWGLLGPRQVGIGRYLPTLTELTHTTWAHHPAVSKVLLSGIIASLLVVAGTGIAIDRLASLPFVGSRAIVTGVEATPALDGRGGVLVATAHADDHGRREGRRTKGGKWLKEAHEVAANLLFAFVGLHVAYLLTFKRRLALFMLFIFTPPHHHGRGVDDDQADGERPS